MRADIYFHHDTIILGGTKEYNCWNPISEFFSERQYKSVKIEIIGITISIGTK